MSQQSNSQDDKVGTVGRLLYLAGVLNMHVARLRSVSNFDFVVADLACYQDVLTRYAGKRLAEARALEIGYGQRPFRLIALNWIGTDAVGIDLDEPVYDLDLQRIARLLKANGVTRTTKSLVRRAIFDPSEYRKLSSVLRAEFGTGQPFDARRLLSGDASRPAVWSSISGELDLILSEDVFEHIPIERIPPVLEMMAKRMRGDSLAIIAPMIFTGISGGHDLDWYPHRVHEGLDGRTPPWGHLTRQSRPADTYLNELRRSDYRRLFERHFDILEEVDLYHRLGEHHLTGERRAQLAGYSDEDLFANKVRFVLRKR
ncbi:hypothetical protein ACTZWT_23670 [Rhodopseudomonas sp. NSM]|uniref:hypothetical protein n=1 Tax=Rhodopseudomonas sp. NSM TaxID=3457630 RepID=UPI0040360560